MVENGNDGSREKDGVPLMVAREGHGLTVAQRGQVVTQLIGNSTGVPDSRACSQLAPDTASLGLPEAALPPEF